MSNSIENNNIEKSESIKDTTERKVINPIESDQLRESDLGSDVVKEITTAADFSRDVIKQEGSKDAHANLKSKSKVCKNGNSNFVYYAALVPLTLFAVTPLVCALCQIMIEDHNITKCNEEKLQIINERDQLNDVLVENYLKAIEDAAAKATASRPAKLELVGGVSASGIIQTQALNSEFVMKSDVSVNTSEGKTDIYVKWFEVKWFENDGSNEKYKVAEVLKFTNSNGEVITINPNDPKCSPLTQALNKFNENCSIKEDEVGKMSAADVVARTAFSALDNSRSI